MWSQCVKCVKRSNAVISVRIQILNVCLLSDFIMCYYYYITTSNLTSGKKSEENY